MIASLGSNRLLGLGALPLQRRKPLLGFDGVGAHTGLFLIVVIGASCFCSSCHFGGRGHMLRGVEIADHNVDQLALFLGDQIVFVTKLAHYVGVVGQRGH